ncbi:MAG: hypothetical protein RR571_02770 [Anaerorhabdus sp.]
MSIVYHYTSPEGLFQILGSRTLRFTDCQYLNDSMELSYPKEIFENTLKEVMFNQNEKIDVTIEEITNKIFDKDVYVEEGQNDGNIQSHQEECRYYILCASKNSDSSSMWNYFIKNSMYHGYNLGVEIEKFKEAFEQSVCNCNNTELLVGDVIYDEECLKREFHDKISQICANYKEKSSIIHGKYNGKRELDNFCEKLKKIYDEKKLFFKSSVFSSEEEYRFVIKTSCQFDTNDVFKLEFRVGTSGIITPFISWKFDLNAKENMFKIITFAPMIEFDLAKSSLKRFLATTVYNNIKIAKSSMNIRF